MPTRPTKHRRHKPMSGQRSLLPDVPTVTFCRRCGLRLYTAKSCEAGAGPTCMRHLENVSQDENHVDRQRTT
jgi:hypothetical protein